MYSNDHVREDGESEVDFSASVADISAVAQYTVGGKLDLSASTDWEVALIDFCMPNNLETFPSSGVENKSKAYVGVDLDYAYNGVHKKLLWEISLPHVEYDIPSCHGLLKRYGLIFCLRDFSLSTSFRSLCEIICTLTGNIK